LAIRALVLFRDYLLKAFDAILLAATGIFATILLVLAGSTKARMKQTTSTTGHFLPTIFMHALVADRTVGIHCEREACTLAQLFTGTPWHDG